jgi:predicted anti-sigma-YlaC factor YlaD
MPEGLTVASLMTPGGAIIAAALITSLVELLKAAAPGLDARVSGALIAFVASAVLYVLVAIALWPLTADGILNVFAAWLACAIAAVGIKSTATHVANVTAGTA